MREVSLLSPGEIDLVRERLDQGRRSPLEMTCDILGVLSEGPTNPTRILQRANLGWKVLASRLDYLNGRGLVEKVVLGERRIEYRLTEKGRSIFRLYESLRLSLSGAANVYPTAEVYPLIERLHSARRGTDALVAERA